MLKVRKVNANAIIVKPLSLPSSHRINLEIDRLHSAELAEVLFQLRLAGLPAQATDENLPVLGSGYRGCIAGFRFGVCAVFGRAICCVGPGDVV